jgi:hypothetical protein
MSFTPEPRRAQRFFVENYESGKKKVEIGHGRPRGQRSEVKGTKGKAIGVKR